MASGHMNRVKRPDTWLHRPMLQNVKKVLANPEPSTQDPTRTLILVDRCRSVLTGDRQVAPAVARLEANCPCADRRPD